MNFFVDLFKKLPSKLRWAFLASRVVRDVLDDDIVKMAFDWALIASERFQDDRARNEKCRAFVVDMLIARGIPESVARLATEIAVQLLKKGLQNATTNKQSDRHL